MQGLPFDTATQFAALGLALFAGWLFGLASRSGRGKWRDRYQDEELRHRTFRTSAEATQGENLRRIRELEAEVARLRSRTVEGVGAHEPGWRGWFGWGRDNLARIRGIDTTREQLLNEGGIKTYRDVEKMSLEDEAVLEQRLGMGKGAIAAANWREQAALLRAGDEDEHARRFG